MAKKTTCPITRAQFRADAKPVTITIGGETIQVPVKFFSTNSLGWYLNKKVEIDVGGTKVPVQIGLNLTIVGSKELPLEPAPAHHDAPAPAAHHDAPAQAASEHAPAAAHSESHAHHASGHHPAS